MKLGSELVPHGQEVRVGTFRNGDGTPQMVIRCKGHSTEGIVVDVKGEIPRKFDLNPSPNNTGMEVVYWEGRDGPARFYNGGMLYAIFTVLAQTELSEWLAPGGLLTERFFSLFGCKLSLNPRHYPGQFIELRFHYPALRHQTARIKMKVIS